MTMNPAKVDAVKALMDGEARSPHFRVELSHEEAGAVLAGRFDCLTVLEAADEAVPRMSYGEGNPNNGLRHLSWSVGREGSEVMYATVVKAYMPGADFKALSEHLEGIGHACGCDEVKVTDEDGSLTVRYWWD